MDCVMANPLLAGAKIKIDSREIAQNTTVGSWLGRTADGKWQQEANVKKMEPKYFLLNGKPIKTGYSKCGIVLQITFLTADMRMLGTGF